MSDILTDIVKNRDIIITSDLITGFEKIQNYDLLEITKKQ